MAKHPRWTRRHFTDEDLDAIARAVVEAEATTSGEIRVHLEPHVPRRAFLRPGHPFHRARELFAALGMTRTRHRNGVLIYVAVNDRKLAVIGDAGIHARVSDEYWDRVRDLMIAEMRRGPVRDGIVAAVRDVAAVLAQHFPPGPDDTRELPDDVSLGS